MSSIEPSPEGTAVAGGIETKILLLALTDRVAYTLPVIKWFVIETQVRIRLRQKSELLILSREDVIRFPLHRLSSTTPVRCESLSLI